MTGTPRPCYRSISIVADGRLEVCDGAHCAFVMKKGGGQILGVASKGCSLVVSGEAIHKTFPPCLLPASPIAWFSTAVGHCKHGYFQERFPIDDGEGKLPKRVFAEIAEVEGPAVRSLSDSFHCLADGNFKLFCRD